MQRPAQEFSCEYCKIFKNTYFEKHMWTASSGNQDFSDKFTEGRYFLNFINLLIKAFSFQCPKYLFDGIFFFLSNHGQKK